MENYTISILREFSSLFFKSLPSSLGSGLAFSTKQLNTSNTISLIIRQDNHSVDLVNVFDDSGQKLVTIERGIPRSTHWHIYSFPDRIKVANITIGLMKRHLDTPHENATLLKLNSGVLGKLHRHFHDDDGKLYTWNRRSQYLERISNPGGGHEEHHERVAYIHQLRNNRFDWELLVDSEHIGLIKALATAFITLKTHWSNFNTGIVPGKLHKPQKPIQSFVLPHDQNNTIHLEVYEPKEPSQQPRDFFNPPDFLKTKLSKGAHVLKNNK